MAEDQQNTFQSPLELGGEAAIAAAAALAALASGAVLRAQEVVALADESGEVEIPVTSTCIESLRYRLISGNLDVTFTDGSVYPYHRVPMFNFLRWLNAPSRGSFFNSEVRGRWT